MVAYAEWRSVHICVVQFLLFLTTVEEEGVGVGGLKGHFISGDNMRRDKWTEKLKSKNILFIFVRRDPILSNLEMSPSLFTF